MSYQIPYEAEFECPKGHRFKADAVPGRMDAEARCRECWNDWIRLNVPNGKQTTEAKAVPQGVALL